MALADAGPGSLSGDKQAAPPATGPSASDLSPRDSCPQPCSVCVRPKVERSFYFRPIYTPIIAKANSSRSRTPSGLSNCEKYEQISVGATLYTRTSSQDIHLPGEGQRTHAHQVRDRGRPQEHWTSCDRAARLTTSPLSCTRRHPAQHPEVGLHPRGEPAQAARRPGPAAHPPAPGRHNCRRPRKGP